MEGDHVVFAQTTGGSSSLCLASKSSNGISAAVRVLPNSVVLLSQGEEESEQPYTTSIIVGDTIDITGTAIFYSNVPQIEASLSSSDNSTNISTTSWVTSYVNTYVTSTLETYSYSEAFTTNGDIVTVPARCKYVDLVVVSQGGKAGETTWAAPSYYYNTGGAGGGGTTVTINKVAVYENQLFKVNVNNNNSNGNDYIRVYYTNGVEATPTSSSTFTQMCEVYAGANGSSTEQGGNTGGAGGGSAPTPSLNTTFGTWQTFKGTSGASGYRYQMPSSGAYPSTGVIPLYGGHPAGSPFVEGARG